ncbi:hypothetical protein N9Y23_07535 [Pseudomonadales bacterium]|nr:hypothetical protein [Pseudomonadales bacterium]MDB2596153.1 hypothetical protein [Pseudomonadales bacterium]
MTIDQGRRSDSTATLDEIYIREIRSCEELLSMLEEIVGNQAFGEITEAIFKLTYKHIPFEICSETKKLERLEELDCIAREIESEIAKIVSDEKLYEEWLSHYPILSKFSQRQHSDKKKILIT